MASIEIESEKVKIAGENIKQQAKECNKIFEELFFKIENLENNKTWIGENGNSAVKSYINKVRKDKVPYSEYTMSIYKLGERVVEYSNKIASLAETNKM